MLFEGDVIDRVIEYLLKKKYSIIHRSNAYEHGYDLVAISKKGVKLIIEAKGQTSSKPGTKRYGREFTPSQKFDHVSKAVLKAMQALNEEGDIQAGIALPADQRHVNLVNRVYPSLKKIGLKIFLVEKNGNVIEK